MEMEMMERYIYAVVHKLPEQQRAEIEKELRGLIEDMLEERCGGNSPTPLDVEQVLLELGNPRELAAKYRGYASYLIGPRYFYAYLTVLKMVGFALLIGVTIASVVNALVHSQIGIGSATEYIGALVNAGMQGFLWITIIFAIIERQSLQKGEHSNTKPWSPSELPPLPNKATRIKPKEPIISIIFSVFFFIMLLSFLDLIAVYLVDGNGIRTVVPLFTDSLRSYYPVLFVMVGLSILQQSLKLIIGRWTRKLAIYNLLCSIGIFIAVIIVFIDPSVWNTDFIAQLSASSLVGTGGEGFATLQKVWDNSRQLVIAITGIIFAIDIISAFHKASKTDVRS
jgi:hypothetical protein